MKESAFTSNFAAAIEGFIAEKHALGFAFRNGAWQLGRFDKYCAEEFPGKAVLDRELVMVWAELRDGEHPNTLLRRASTVRGLAQYMNRMDATAFVIPKGIPAHEIDYVPRIYTHDEVSALLDAADTMVVRKKVCRQGTVPCL